MKEVLLIVGSVYALVKACLSKNVFATRVISGMLATNLVTVLAMAFLLVALGLQD